VLYRHSVEEFRTNDCKTDGKILDCIICHQAMPVTKHLEILQYLNFKYKQGKQNSYLEVKYKKSIIINI